MSTDGDHYYNEFDPAAAEWLRNLMAAGEIPHGVIDTRSITDVQPDELEGFVQCHFFAGIGGWALAARIAAWPAQRELWTGSCPCQPFSAAGKRKGAADERHLWPHFLRLIRARRPAAVMGEQVAGAAGYGWFDGVRADLAREAYASRAVDIPALAVNAPHGRSRLYWIAHREQPMANADGRRQPGISERDQRAEAGIEAPRGHDADRRHLPDRGCGAAETDPAAFDVAYPYESELAVGDRQPAGKLPVHEQDAGPDGRRGQARTRSSAMGDASGEGLERHGGHGAAGAGWPEPYRPAAPADVGEFWAGAEWILCHDGKARRTQPGLPLLVNGLRGRVAIPRPDGLGLSPFTEETRWVSRNAVWKGAGNAIVPQEAAVVIQAYRDCYPDNY